MIADDGLWTIEVRYSSRDSGIEFAAHRAVSDLQLRMAADRRDVRSEAFQELVVSVEAAVYEHENGDDDDRKA
jgi:hypothetical protein